MTPTHRDPTWIIALLIAAALAALLLLPREAGGLMLWGLATLSAVVLGRRWIRRGAQALVQAWKRRAARSAGPLSLIHIFLISTACDPQYFVVISRHAPPRSLRTTASLSLV